MGLKIFNPNNQLSKTINIIFDVFTLSICWFLCCIPLFTTGLSCTGLYYAIDHHTLNNDEHCIKGFVKSIKSNFKQGILVYLIVLVIGILIAWSMWISYQAMNAGLFMGKVTFVSGIVFSIYYIGYINYLFPTLANFSNKTSTLFSLCFKLSIIHLPTTLIMSLLVIMTAYMAYNFWIILFFMPAVIAIIQRCLLKRIYKKYS